MNLSKLINIWFIVHHLQDTLTSAVVSQKSPGSCNIAEVGKGDILKLLFLPVDGSRSGSDRDYSDLAASCYSHENYVICNAKCPPMGTGGHEGGGLYESQVPLQTWNIGVRINVQVAQKSLHQQLHLIRKIHISNAGNMVIESLRKQRRTYEGLK